MWKSPIQMITDDIIKDLVQKQGVWLMESVHRAGFNIDKYELMKALNYDRDQYEKGYADGRSARDSEIVRCKDCIHRPYLVPAKYDSSGKCIKYAYVTSPDDVCPYLCDDTWYNRVPEDNFFCASGDRKETEDDND